MRTVTVTLAGLVLAAVLAAGQGRMARSLDIYLIDVEGGNATLFVSPSGESLLMDTGNGGAAATRDADRIMAAITSAGLTTRLNEFTIDSPKAPSEPIIRAA